MLVEVVEGGGKEGTQEGQVTNSGQVEAEASGQSAHNDAVNR